MPRTRPPYPAQYRSRWSSSSARGATPSELAREFEPSAQAIRNWVREADRGGGGLEEARPLC